MAKKEEHEKEPNHERWLVSYADFITLLFAWALVRAVAGTMSIDLPRAAEISVTGPVLAFAVVVSMTVGLIVGLAPGLKGANRTGRPFLHPPMGPRRPSGTRSRK